jgi:hypothetical protein
MRKADLKPDKKNQGGKKAKRLWTDDFASVAKRLECDEDKTRFEEKLGKLAKAKPPEKA